MKVFSGITLLFLILCIIPFAQAQEINKSYKSAVVESLSQLILDYYVYEEVAQNTVEHLKESFAAGKFDTIQDLEVFSKALTETVQFINKDKHMNIRPKRIAEAPNHTPERLVEDLLYNKARQRESVAGFRAVKKFKGNIGYLDLRGFAEVSWGAKVADHYMYLLESADAIIIDLRKNGGGHPAMVQYLCSYFFDKKVHLNSLYWRAGNQTVEYWTLDEVGGTKMPEVPLFVLTGARTFSGAEEFSYNMQTQKRATLVGVTTGGGANPGDILSINEDLTVFVPTGAAVNPITQTNWEGLGVVPEVKVEEAKALDKALELAEEAAEAFRKDREGKQKALLTNLQDALVNYKSGTSEEGILNQLKACRNANLLHEGEINMLGYEYLGSLENPIAAEVIFKCNTLLYPASANTYDSYGEALAKNGKIKAALKNYQKAVKLAQANKDANLELYQANLEKIKTMSGDQ